MGGRSGWLAAALLGATLVGGGADAAARAPVPATANNSYRWIDEADVMAHEIAGWSPDRAFRRGNEAGFLWTLADGARVIAEPMGAGGATRFYFFAPGTATPFLVRDGVYGFSFEGGVAVFIHDRFGAPVTRPGEPWLEQMGPDLASHGRALLVASETRDDVTTAPDGLASALIADWDLGRASPLWQAFATGAGKARRTAREATYRAAAARRRQEPWSVVTAAAGSAAAAGGMQVDSEGMLIDEDYTTPPIAVATQGRAVSDAAAPTRSSRALTVAGCAPEPPPANATGDGWRRDFAAGAPGGSTQHHGGTVVYETRSGSTRVRSLTCTPSASDRQRP